MSLSRFQALSAAAKDMPGVAAVPASPHSMAQAMCISTSSTPSPLPPASGSGMAPAGWRECRCESPPQAARAAAGQARPQAAPLEARRVLCAPRQPARCSATNSSRARAAGGACIAAAAACRTALGCLEICSRGRGWRAARDAAQQTMEPGGARAGRRSWRAAAPSWPGPAAPRGAAQPLPGARQPTALSGWWLAMVGCFRANAPLLRRRRAISKQHARTCRSAAGSRAGGRRTAGDGQGQPRAQPQALQAGGRVDE